MLVRVRLSAGPIVAAPAARSNGVRVSGRPCGWLCLMAAGIWAGSQRALGDAGRACYLCSGREGLCAMPTPARFCHRDRARGDGRWIAEIPALSGVLAYGATREEAIARAKALVLRGREAGTQRADWRSGRFVRGRVSRWPSTKARRVLAELLRQGWQISFDCPPRTWVAFVGNSPHSRLQVEQTLARYDQKNAFISPCLMDSWPGSTSPQ